MKLEVFHESSMKAILLHHHGGPEVLQYTDFPAPEPGPGEVLVKLEAAALNRMDEWELHFKGAIRNGVSKTELRAVIHQISIYCGVPAGVECFRIAKRVLVEEISQN